MNDATPVLAIYVFRSKQEFIYRTNYMREITGASELIAGMYQKFISQKVAGASIRNDWRDLEPKPLMSFGAEDGSEVGGVVVYEGGGNLLVLYKDREFLCEANHVFSRMVIEEAYSLAMVCANVEWEASCDNDVSDFEWNRRRVYRELDRVKRSDGISTPCNVLPFTQIDRATFQPIVEKSARFYGDETRDDLTQEGISKRAAYGALGPDRRKEGEFVDELGTEKGTDSLIAVLYFDGNSIGERLKAAVKDRADDVSDVEAMRAFSSQLHEKLVGKTEDAIRDALAALPEEYRGYRVIIDHGDEITLICNAHAAPFALDAYFMALSGSGYHACAGMAICHSHDPFAQVYRIAEECCESGKRLNRKMQKEAIHGLTGKDQVTSAQRADANYIDIHFCRSGITGSLEQIRGAQEIDVTARPYKVGGSYDTFIEVGKLLASSMRSRGGIKRSDIKELSRAILRGYSWYVLEYERLKAKDCKAMLSIEDACCSGGLQEDDRRRVAMTYLFDATSLFDVFDLRFGVSEKEVEHV